MSPTHQDLSNDTTFSQIKSRVSVPLRNKEIHTLAPTTKKFYTSVITCDHCNFITYLIPVYLRRLRIFYNVLKHAGPISKSWFFVDLYIRYFWDLINLLSLKKSQYLGEEKTTYVSACGHVQNNEYHFCIPDGFPPQWWPCCLWLP